jgi:NADPH:quinone reductase-like Zn-dependent oxidoreductase
MKTIGFQACDNPGVVQLGEVDDTSPSAGEVLVRVAVTSFVPIDYKMRIGDPCERMQVDFSSIPGAGRGACPELTSISADLLAVAPKDLALEDAAALPSATLVGDQVVDEAGKADIRCLVQAIAG